MSFTSSLSPPFLVRDANKIQGGHELLEEVTKESVHIFVLVWHILAFARQGERSEIKVTDKVKEGLKLRESYEFCCP